MIIGQIRDRHSIKQYESKQVLLIDCIVRRIYRSRVFIFSFLHKRKPFLMKKQWLRLRIKKDFRWMSIFEIEQQFLKVKCWRQGSGKYNIH